MGRGEGWKNAEKRGKKISKVTLWLCVFALCSRCTQCNVYNIMCAKASASSPIHHSAQARGLAFLDACTAV